MTFDSSRVENDIVPNLNEEYGIDIQLNDSKQKEKTLKYEDQFEKFSKDILDDITDS